MKIKLMNLFAASFAAATLFSCSNEIEEQSGGNALNPGEAGIEIDLGGGKTTYSTDEQEKAILDGSGKFFNTDGEEVQLKNPIIKNNKFTATVELPDGKPLSGTLMLYANTGDTNIELGGSETDSDMERFRNAITTVRLGTEMKSLPAGHIVSPITLKPGSMTEEKLSLKRSVSRIVTKSGSTSIVGYSYSLKNVSLDRSTLFVPSTKVVTTTELNGALTSDTQLLAYLYSSSGVVITVTPPTGEPKEVLLNPGLNKDYTLLITPSTTTNPDGEANFDVTIEDWADEDVPVDFSKNYAKFDLFGEYQTAFKVLDGKNGFAVKSGYNKINVNLNEVLELSDLYDMSSVEILPEPNTGTALVVVPGPGAVDISITAAANYAGDDIYKTVKVNYTNRTKAATITRTEYFHVYLLNQKASLEKVLVDMNGTKWVPFNTSGSLTKDVEIADAILAATGASTAEKVANYAMTSEANYANVQGTFFLSPAAFLKCPEGYRVANLADYNSLAGGNVVVPKRGTGAPSPVLAKWGLKTTPSQEFTNSTLNRVQRTNVYSNALGFYFEFVSKNGGNKLPFIGTSSQGPENSNTVILATDITNQGMAIFTGEKRGSNNERVAFWEDGIANNEALPTLTSNIRCVKNN